MQWKGHNSETYSLQVDLLLHGELVHFPILYWYSIEKTDGLPDKEDLEVDRRVTDRA